MKVITVSITCLLGFAAMGQLKLVESGVYAWKDHQVKKGEDRESRRILEGTSPHLDYLEIHATQFPGAKPSNAHANEDIEECIIVTEGVMKVTIEGKSTMLGPEGVILLMPKQMHAVQNAGTTNLTYFVMRYRSKRRMDLARGTSAGGSLMLNADSLASNPVRGVAAAPISTGQLPCVNGLRCTLRS